VTVVAGGLLGGWMAREPDATAALDLTDRRLTVSELDTASAQLAARLDRMTGPPGIVVAALPNRIEAMVAAFAVLRSRHALVMVHPDLPAPIREKSFDRWRPVAEIVHDGPSLDAVPQPYGPAAALWSPPRRRPDTAIALCVLTSGSTGRPRLIAAPHHQVRTAVRLISQRLGYRPNDLVAAVPPLSFDYGLYQLLLCAASGATVLLDPRMATIQGLSYAIASAGVTVLPLVPSTLRALAGSPMTARIDTRRVRLITTTGDLLTEADTAAARTAFPAAMVLPMYGLSECKRVAITPRIGTRPSGAVGLPLDGTDVTVVDGELVVTGPHLTAGYVGDVEATAVRFTVDVRSGIRLLRTGDRLRQDEAGWLHWIGRGTDLIKTSGFRLAPAELETAAATSGVVAESGAYGRPDCARGQVPVLVVRLFPTAGTDAVAVLDETLRRRLPRWAVPEVCVQDDPLPRTRNGKLDRSALAGPPQSLVDSVSIDDRQVARTAPIELTGRPVGRQFIHCHTQAFLSAFALPYDLTPAEFELLTTVPFGVRAHVDDPHRLLVPYLDPDLGLDRAAALLGLDLETVWHRPNEGSAALTLLDGWLRTGPVLAGPLDLGRLTYHDAAETLRGCDHYLVVLGRDEDGRFVVRDPEGFVHVDLAEEDLLAACAAKSVPEGRGPYTLRRLARGGDTGREPPVGVLLATAALALDNLVAAAGHHSGGGQAYRLLSRLALNATHRRGLSLLLPAAGLRYDLASFLVRALPDGAGLGELLDAQMRTLAEAHADVVDGIAPGARFDEAAAREDLIARHAARMRRLIER
jgi:acyl-CoA synthetase (AMP-forming)/AMP-acid ligase II